MSSAGSVTVKSGAGAIAAAVRKAEGLAPSALVFAAYCLGGRIGLAVPFTSGNVSPVWPPSGIALAGILLFGTSVWPAVACGAFIVNFFSALPHSVALGIAAGNTAGPLVGAWLLRRLPGFRPTVERLRDVLGLVVFGALGGTAISATFGALALSAGHVHAWSNLASAWLIWWLGDAMGVLILTPLVLTMARLPTLRRHASLEFTALMAGTIAVCAVVFRTRAGVGHDILALTLFPFVMWGAIRLESAGAAATSSCIAAVAVWNTAHGLGPFADTTSSLQSATLMQSFLAVVAVSGLSLAALVAERTRLVRADAERVATRRGERRYREITETANEGVWMLDSQLLTCFVNRRMTRMLGYAADEMIGQPVVAFMFAEDVGRKQADLERRKRGISEQRDDRFRRKDGSELWVRVSTTGSFDADGRFTGVLAMVSDITEQKRKEAQGKDAVDAVLLLARAVEQAADSIFITDRNGVIEYVNPAFEVTTGYEWDEAVGRTAAILKSGRHDRTFYSQMWDEILRGRPFNGTLINRKRNGQVYWAEQTITPIRGDDGEIAQFVSVLKDVTDLRRKHEQEIQLRLARQVQQRFYGAPILVPGLEMAAASYPADETGGDYFDFIPAAAGSVYVAVGDASGHGFSSALVMALTRAYVRSFAALNLDVSEILARVNRMLISDLEDNRFVTLLLAHVDAPNRVLSYANAGQVPGFVIGRDATVQWAMESTGPPMGLFAHSVFPRCEKRLEPGDLVLLVTDGITESGDPEQFGSERAVECARRECGLRSADIAERICQAARAFAGDDATFDDLTSVVVKVDTAPV